MLAAYESVLTKHHPYVVATPSLLRELNLAPLGLAIEKENCFDPTRTASAPFLGRLERLDALAYGPLEMATPRWALYDCAELPGIVFGFGRLRSELPAELQRQLGVDDAAPDLIPVSMHMAVPMLEAGQWLACAMTELPEVCADTRPVGLRALGAALSLSVLGATRAFGITQWASPNMQVHARFSPLEVRAAWLATHTDSATCIFSFDVDELRVARALADEPVAGVGEHDMLDVRDADALTALQRRIECGERAFIIGQRVERGEQSYIPVRYGAAS